MCEIYYVLMGGGGGESYHVRYHLYQQLFYFKILKYNSLSLKLYTIRHPKLIISKSLLHYKHTPRYNIYYILVIHIT